VMRRLEWRRARSHPVKGSLRSAYGKTLGRVGEPEPGQSLGGGMTPLAFPVFDRGI
jgi:hypothetical protein